jgi:hypothetical protein
MRRPTVPQKLRRRDEKRLLCSLEPTVADLSVRHGGHEDREVPAKAVSSRVPSRLGDWHEVCTLVAVSMGLLSTPSDLRSTFHRHQNRILDGDKRSKVDCAV